MLQRQRRAALRDFVTAAGSQLTASSRPHALRSCSSFETSSLAFSSRSSLSTPQLQSNKVSPLAIRSHRLTRPLGSGPFPPFKPLSFSIRTRNRESEFIPAKHPEQKTKPNISIKILRAPLNCCTFAPRGQGFIWLYRKSDWYDRNCR